ncbi:MAG: cytochrome oxidase subunit [Betaproteobacteria bacterium]|nr:cytochrome oxidase subunit [Betaproteobacteria bacterium]
MPSLNSDPVLNPRQRRSRLVLWLVLAVCAAPVVASFVTFYVWRPSGHVNYGELLPPKPLPDVAMTTLDGKPFRFSDLKGEWVLVTADRAACDERCRTELVYTRQIRLAQAKEAERVERVWLVTDGGAPDAAMLKEQPDLRVVRANGFEQALPAPHDVTAHVFVVDPLGNLMMRFPENADPRRMLKDVSRLLRHSKWK